VICVVIVVASHAFMKREDSTKVRDTIFRTTDRRNAESSRNAHKRYFPQIAVRKVTTTMTMIARSAATRVASRAVVSQQTRSLSTKEPKLHAAKGRWEALKAKRPIDHDEEHVGSDLLQNSRFPLLGKTNPLSIVPRFR